ncbi:ATP-binding protein [Virgibacillus sp. M23]|uniref:ATP-binding protein n=1 Tax=Virgibacillus sp. M23 TaxID=3079030 RepID=UPI002A915CEA|nr:ATP-binding protein [Virgibacillus sp. M23]MDY7046526.1 ATP-binding protein [Virgibacillus sp. M23]
MKKDIAFDGSIISVLMGKQITAKYNEQEIPKYRKNPLIEALPAINSQIDVGERLLNFPDYYAEDRQKPPEIRLHYIEQVRDYMQPLLVHLQIESNLSIMIRRGYVSRNPLSPFYAKQFAVGIKEILNVDLDEDGKNIIGNQSTAKSYTIIGISGIGKTTAIEKILLMYPQVIIHSDYKYNGLELGYLKQIVWIKLECPFNGSRKSLCQQFFLTVDQILQTNYYKKFVKSRINEEDLIIAMSHVCSLHCVGVLVIDEIQRMKKGEAGQLMLDFFVDLSNKLGVPLVYIGTYKAIPLFNKLLANGRRASGMGSEFLDPMTKEDEWDLFLSNLWEYQWTEKKVPLTEELSNAMYELTQGVTDFVINLFIKSQQYAIAYGQEELSVRLLKTVAKQNLKLVQGVIDALRIGDKEKIKQYDDIKPGWNETNEYVKALGNRLGLHGKVNSEHKRAINKNKYEKNFEILLNFALNFDLSEKEARTIVEDAMNSNKGMKALHEQQTIITQMIKSREVNKDNKLNKKLVQSKTVNHFSNKNDIRLIAENAKKQKVALEEALRDANIVKSFDEFLN